MSAMEIYKLKPTKVMAVHEDLGLCYVDAMHVDGKVIHSFVRHAPGMITTAVNRMNVLNSALKEHGYGLTEEADVEV